MTYLSVTAVAVHINAVTTWTSIIGSISRTAIMLPQLWVGTDRANKLDEGAIIVQAGVIKWRQTANKWLSDAA